MIRNATPGTEVNILAFYGDAHGIVAGKARKSGHVWYTIEVVDPGDSRFHPGDTLELRCHWLTRRWQ